MEEVFRKNFVKKENSKETVFSADEVIEKRHLGGGGAHGDVYEVEVVKGLYKGSYAIKVYSEKDEHERKIKVSNAYQNYRMCKEAGIKVFQTLRISEDNSQLVMTLGTDKDFTLISGNSLITWDKVEKIDNLQDLFSQMEENVLCAAGKKIMLPCDSYFFITEKSNPTNAQFVIGDYDAIHSSRNSKENIFIRNLMQMKFALIQFFDRYIVEGKIQEYKECIDDRLRKFETVYRKSFS